MGKIRTLRRWALPVFLAAASGILATVLTRTVMPSAPTAEPDGRPARQDSPVLRASPSVEPTASDLGQEKTDRQGKTDQVTMCYVNAERVRYRARPNTMSVSYGLAHKGQAFALKRYVQGGGGNRWGFGDLRGARADVYVLANRLNC